MTENAISWAAIESEAASLADPAGELVRLSGWLPEALDEQCRRFGNRLGLENEPEAQAALLEILLMRDRLTPEGSSDDPLPLPLLQTMWLRKWSLEEATAALDQVEKRLGVAAEVDYPRVEALFGVSVLIRLLGKESGWPEEGEIEPCAEVMWLTNWSVELVARRVAELRKRYGFRRREGARVLDEARKIELLVKHAGFDDTLTENTKRQLAEIMWVRDWDRDRLEAKLVEVGKRLFLATMAGQAAALFEICARCGGKDRPNEVTRALERICEDAETVPSDEDDELTRFAEFLWLGTFTPGLALTKLGQFARVNRATLYETFDVLYAMERKRYCERRSRQRRP